MQMLFNSSCINHVQIELITDLLNLLQLHEALAPILILIAFHEVKASLILLMHNGLDHWRMIISKL